METLGSWRPFPPLPGPARGPLCRSAASGHSVRARALPAPPPHFEARSPLPPLFGPFCRETLFWLKTARFPSRMDLGPPPSTGPSGRGGTTPFPLGLPRGAGPKLGLPGRAPA